MDKHFSKFLAIDLGAESGRGFVGTLDSGKIFLEEIHRFPNLPIVIEEHLHWDISGLFEEVKNSIRLAVQKGHDDIESVGIDSWGVDFGLVKSEDGTVDPPFTYRDSRTNGMMERVFEKMSKKEIFARTGIQFMRINSLYQLYSMSGNFNGIDKLLFTPDLINYFLAGRRLSEYTIASTSQMLNATGKCWDGSIFTRLNLPSRIMAPIIHPGMVIGPLLPEISRQAGLGRDINVVAVASHDTASAVTAVPSSEDEWAFLSSGTWSLIGEEIDNPIINELSLASNFTNEGGANGKITFLQSIMGLWLLQEIKRGWEKDGRRHTYDELVSMAQDAEKFKCIVDPGDGLFLNPTDMEDAIVDFCRRTNQPVPESKGEFVRCVFESLAFKYWSALQKINVITGRTIETLHIVGGGCQNEMLNQFTADATGIPVIAGPVEAAVIGNILVQAMAAGKIKSVEEGRAIVKDSFKLRKYIPHHDAGWDEAYKRIHFGL